MKKIKKLKIISIIIGILFLGGIALVTKPTQAAVVTKNDVSQTVDLSSSLNWAGYITTGGTFTGVSGTWTIPSVSTTTASYGADATWVGIGGVTAHDLIQAGTQAITEPNGTISYQAWYELLPGISKTVALTVNPGDSITSTITQDQNSNWVITLTDNTTGNTYSKTVTYASSLSSAEWIEEMPAMNVASANLDNFGTIQFTNGWTIKNGIQTNLVDTGAQSINMKNISGQTVATPSTILADNSFTITRTDAASSSPSFAFYFRRGRSRLQFNIGRRLAFSGSSLHSRYFNQ